MQFFSSGILVLMHMYLFRTLFGRHDIHSMAFCVSESVDELFLYTLLYFLSPITATGTQTQREKAEIEKKKDHPVSSWCLQFIADCTYYRKDNKQLMQ